MFSINVGKLNIEVVEDKIIKNHLRKLAVREKELIAVRTPVKTGKLKSNLALREIADGFEIFFKRLNDIAFYQHFGTDDHWVGPVNKQALHWVDGGKHAFSKGHDVSGIKAKKFFEIKKTDKPILINLFKRLKIFKRG